MFVDHGWAGAVSACTYCTFLSRFGLNITVCMCVPNPHQLLPTVDIKTGKLGDSYSSSLFMTWDDNYKIKGKQSTSIS